MENLRKVISLHQASIISGYHQDYLSSLIRKKEIKGEKVGRNWFTTEEEIKKYILKQEIRHKKSVLKYFLYFKNINKGFISGFVVLALFSFGIYLDNKSNFNETQVETHATDTQGSLVNKLATKEEVKELQF
ncbi:MAG: hypothetical protein KBC06_02670 [Candidatus Pacebacteria bacterium]|nr:hypothetical protein [Candidatus Paceibacterota bacterium]